jgi:Zn-dependent protease with chaperone function
MLPLARYHDGKVASSRDVTFAITRDTPTPDFIIADASTSEEIDRWPLADMFEVPARDTELLLGARSRETGARVRIGDPATAAGTRKLMPGLEGQRRTEGGQQFRIIAIATAALASIVGAYVFGIPLLASRIVPLIPTEWEASLGQAAIGQIDQIIAASDIEKELCDPDPDSLANRAIKRLATQLVEGSNSPFTPNVEVVYLGLANAFALPGGHSYVFSELLEYTSTPDEFAAVLAHEMGHVVHRHALEGLIATSSTGLLVGFVMGDMTGLSVAGGLASSIIDTRYSRDAERQADAFAAAAGERLGFRPVALADLLDKISADNPTEQMLQVFSTHPLTAERRAALEAMPDPPPGLQVFTPEEWEAIEYMCW